MKGREVVPPPTRTSERVRKEPKKARDAKERAQTEKRPRKTEEPGPKGHGDEGGRHTITGGKVA
jgi:hypothetical protein